MKSSPSPADVVIIGGGLSGLLVAHRLERCGLSCLVLEAGPSSRRTPPSDLLRFEKATKRLLEVDEEAWKFRTTGLAYDWIRVRAMGGRSLLWGGWCSQMDAQNFRDARACKIPWLVSLDELAPYYRSAEKQLRVRKGKVSPFLQQVSHKLGLDVVAKQAAMVPIKTRTMSGLDLPRPVKLRTQAVALRLVVIEGRIRQVEIFDGRTGKVQLLPASAVVLCASPIETTRLLLTSGIHGDGLVGANLVDHLVATCLAVLPYSAPSSGPLGPLERCAFIPRFVNLGRQRRRDYRGGFSVEAIGPIALEQLGTDAVRELGIDAKQAKQLSYCVVNAIGEVQAHNDRFVTIDDNQHDSLGRPIPVVNLAWDNEARLMAADMEESVAAIADALAPPNSRIIRLRETLRPGGIAHEAGTARMGRTAREGVVDSCGKVFGVRGLYVADASVMPTALDRHPTLTLLALALRTSDRVAKDGRDGF